MKYLLDTNVLSEPLKPSPAVAVIKRLTLFESEVATAAPVFHEMQFGVLRMKTSAKRLAIEVYLSDVVLPNIPILPYDQRAAAWHAEQRAQLTADGRSPAFVAGQIAAIAKINGLILVTRNVSDFEPFEGLTVENWHG